MAFSAPFPIEAHLPPGIGSYNLRIGIHSEEATEESIEAADEFVDVFELCVEHQLFGDVRKQPMAGFEVRSKVFDSEAKRFVYDCRVESLHEEAYLVLISLFSQAAKLEEPVSKVVLISDHPEGRPPDWALLADGMESRSVPADALPFELAWEDRIGVMAGPAFSVYFRQPPTEDDFADLENALTLWDNLAFMFAFEFDAGDQGLMLATPATQRPLTAKSFRFASDNDMPMHAMNALFNGLIWRHTSGNPIELVEID